MATPGNTPPGPDPTKSAGDNDLSGFETAHATVQQADGLVAQLRLRLNPLVSRPYLLRNILVSLNFPRPDATIGYLVDTGLLIRDDESTFKLGKCFGWLTGQRLLDQTVPPGAPHHFLPPPGEKAPGNRTGPKTTEASLRYTDFLEKLRLLLASGKTVILRGALAPTNLAGGCGIYKSVGSVLLQHGYLERDGMGYRKHPGLDTLTTGLFMELVAHYVNTTRNGDRPETSPYLPCPVPERPLAVAAPTPGPVVRPAPPLPQAHSGKSPAPEQEPLVSDVVSVLVDAAPVPEPEIYQPATPDFTSGLVPKGNEYVVFFPENVAFFPSEAVATCFAERSVLTDGRQSAIIIKLDPSMKRLKKSVEHGTL